MVEFSVVMVLSLEIFLIVRDRTRGPLLKSGHNLPKGLEGRGLLLQDPAQRHSLEALLGQILLDSLESRRAWRATSFWVPTVPVRSRRVRLAAA